MAPNRKKKKGGANPARGFATTSIASKRQSEVGQNDEAEDGLPGGSSSNATGDNVGTGSSSRSGELQSQPLDKPLHQMSPQELETHLEEANLQNILDVHGLKTNQQISRQVSKMTTENRLLRSQTESLNLHQALSPEMAQDLVDRIYITVEKSVDASPCPSYSSEELLIHVWRLYLVLRDLHFSSAKIEDALALLVRAHLRGSYRNDLSSKDLIWGLDHCLDFLALMHADVESYDSLLAATHADYASDLLADEEALGSDELSTPPIKDRISENESVAAISGAEIFDASIVDNISDLDSDMEPEQMVGIYLSLKERIFQIDPTRLDEPSKYNRKAQNKKEARVADSLDPRIEKLQARLDALTADILFDRQEAEISWSAKRIELVQEASMKRQLGIAKSASTVSDRNPKAKDQTSALRSEDETEIALGDFFEALPDPDSKVLPSQPEDQNADPVEVRHFGKWSGIAPRRILEESCKARDSSATITYRVVSQTLFSNRQKVTVRWSKPQAMILKCPLPSITDHQRHQLQCDFEMVSVACSDQRQSEAFISTVALFGLFSHSAKEEKVYVRLTSIWRELWNELSLKQKEIDDSRERDTLRSLRQLVDSNIELSSKYTREAEQNDLPTQNRSVQAGTRPAKVNNSKSTFLESSWMSRTTTRSYRGMLQSRSQLPIHAFRQNILEAVHHNQIVIVSGATGCGKSTQVPAYILENQLSQGKDCRIYCTEPRRISAISLARRVSEELGDQKNEVGTERSLVGFAVRLDSRVHENNRLVYATTGIVMRMLESSPTLDEVTHLLLDEVHERSIESDFLLIILKKLLEKRPSLRVVLMSATVDAQKFSKYLGDAPVFEVPGRTFPVEVQFLEDAIESTNFKVQSRYGQSFEDEEDDADVESESTMPSKIDVDSSKYSKQTRTTMSSLDEYRIPYDLVVRLLEDIQTGRYQQYNKATLVFLPGIAEIRRLSAMLSGHKAFVGRCEVFALHSSIATEEQERAFLPPPRGMRKVVLATNIAETGITIPDITCVIDTGKHKEMRFDERRQLSRLIAAFVSQANAVQRRGRAGRVQNGLCFHLFSRQRFEKMAKEQTPEMLRLSLQDLVLRVKICGLGDIEQTLSEALDPPSLKNVRRAVDALQDVKALTPTQGLTQLGRKLAALPLDVFLGKMLLLGTLFECLDAALTVAAILSSKSPFVATMGSQAQADLARLYFRKGDSDLLTVYNAYTSWRRVCTTNPTSEAQFCRKNFLSMQNLANIEDLKGQLMTSLLDAGFIILEAEEKAQLNRTRHHHHHRQRQFFDIPHRYNANNDNDPLITSVIAASFYPKILRREGKAYRNVATNQTITLHPTSVNKTPPPPSLSNPRPQTPKWLSFYHIMASGSKHYNAHETSAVDELALVCLCGEAEFKMYAGVVAIDGARVRFKVGTWRQMILLKVVRREVRKVVERWIKNPTRGVGDEGRFWVGCLVQMVSRGTMGGERRVG